MWHFFKSKTAQNAERLDVERVTIVQFGQFNASNSITKASQKHRKSIAKGSQEYQKFKIPNLRGLCFPIRFFNLMPSTKTLLRFAAAAPQVWENVGHSEVERKISENCAKSLEPWIFFFGTLVTF